MCPEESCGFWRTHAGTGEFHMEEGASGRRHYELTTYSPMPFGEEVKEVGDEGMKLRLEEWTG